jgi:hypothetical protein
LNHCTQQIHRDGFIKFHDANRYFLAFENILEVIKTHFPEAVDVDTIVKDVKEALHGLEITNKNTIFAQSVCPDEINHRPGDIINLLSVFFGKAFLWTSWL